MKKYSREAMVKCYHLINEIAELQRLRMGRSR